MDEKTAAIPSLKEFNEQQKERSAHTSRSESMQTKDQMRRSKERQQKKTSAKSSSKSSSKSASRPASNSGSKDRAKGKSSASAKTTDTRRIPPADSRQTQRRPVTREGSAQNPEQRKSQPAPHTYARERNAHPQSVKDERRRKSTDVTSKTGNRIETTPENLKRRGSAVQSKDRDTAPGKSRKNLGKNKKPMSPAMRKFRNFMVYLSIVLIVIIVGGVLSLTVLFRTNNINVNGLNGVYQEQEVLSESGLSLGINIFTAPKARAEDRLEKKFPYIEKADVSSSFPDTINIDITIATPACVVEGLGGYYVVSDKGKVLEVSSTYDEAVPIIEGVSVEATAAGEYIEFGTDVINQTMQEVFAAFKEYDCKNITAINIKAEEDSFAIKYVYDNRIVVFLGLPEHINYKIQTADKIIKEKLDVGGAMVAGDLDVSMCHDTMKSYFNQYTLLAPQVAPSTDSTDPETTTEEVQEEEYTEEEYYDYSDDYYEYDDSYSDDGYYYEEEDGGYSDEEYDDYYEYEENYQSVE